VRGAKPIYDSAAKGRALYDTLKALWDYRELIVILVQRDISVKYKRSVLGLLWTILNPLLTSIILWFVFINVFTAKLPTGTQFAPYVLAGVLMMTFFTQGFHFAAEAIAQGSGVLMKVYVPPQIFAFASAIVYAMNFLFGLVALTFISFIAGDGLSWYFPVTLIVILLMVCFISGLGLMVAVLYIRYQDTRSTIAILLTFMTYLAPVFYPIEILSPTVRRIVECNPLTSFLDVFRFYFSNTGTATLADWAFIIISSLFMLVMGIRTFVKAWPRTVVML
jgi:ABC-2 type transport system permease protein